MIKTKCEKCGKEYHVSEEHIGKKVMCKACGHNYEIKKSVEEIELVEVKSKTNRRQSSVFGFLSVLCCFFVIILILKVITSHGPIPDINSFFTVFFGLIFSAIFFAIAHYVLCIKEKICDE